MLSSHPRQKPDFDVDLVEADLNMISALLDLAEDEFLFGSPAGVRSALKVAEDAHGDGRHRLLRLDDKDYQRLSPRFATLRDALNAMQSRLKGCRFQALSS